MDAIVRWHALFLREGFEYYVSILGFDKVEAFNALIRARAHSCLCARYAIKRSARELRMCAVWLHDVYISLSSMPLSGIVSGMEGCRVGNATVLCGIIRVVVDALFLYLSKLCAVDVCHLYPSMCASALIYQAIVLASRQNIVH